MNTNERPTPETDAVEDICNSSPSCEPLFCSEAEYDEMCRLARKLERERDEARDKLEAVSKRAERIRCDLVQAETSRVTNAALYERAAQERDEARETLDAVRNERDNTWEKLEAMREAIKEAAELVQDCANRCSDATIRTHADDDAKGALDDTIEWAEVALAKLHGAQLCCAVDPKTGKMRLFSYTVTGGNRITVANEATLTPKA